MRALAYLDSGGPLTGIVTFVLLFIAGICLYLGLRSAIRLLHLHFAREPLPEHPVSSVSVTEWAVFFFPLWCMGLLFWAAYFPAGMSVEGLTMWDEAHTGQYDDTNPVGYTLLMRVLASLWDSPAAVSLVQITLLDGLLAYGFALLRNAGVPIVPLALGYGAALLSLRNHSLAMWLYRDVPYGILMLTYTLVLIRLAFTEQSRTRLRTWLLLGLLVGLLPLFRHEGRVHLVLVVPIVLFLFPNLKTRALMSSGVAIVLFLLIQGVVYPSLGVRNAAAVSTPEFWAVQGYARSFRNALSEDAPMRQPVYEFAMAAGFPRPSLFGDYPYGISDAQAVKPHLKNHIGHARDYAAELDRQYRSYRITRSLGRRWERSLFLLIPVSHFRQGLLVPYINSEHPFLVMNDFDNRYGLYETSLVPTVTPVLDKIMRFARDRLSWLYNQPLVPFYVVALGMAVQLGRTREYRYLAVFLPALLNSFVVLAAGASTSCRYHFSLTLCSSILFAFAFFRPTHASEISTISEKT